MLNPPDHSALINPIACSAYAMRYMAREDVVETTVIATGDRPGKPMPAALLDIKTELPVCDALMYIAPFVTVTTPLDPDYAGQFMMARLLVHVDGEVKVAGEPVRRYLLRPPFENSNPQKVILGQHEDHLLGVSELQFLRNDAHILMELQGIPRGAGDIRINAGILMARYTTKAKTGNGFGVGVLDEQQNATAVTRTWDKRQGSLQDKLEDGRSKEIQGLIDAEIERRQKLDEAFKQAEVSNRLLDEDNRRREEEARRAAEDAALKRAKKENQERAKKDDAETKLMLDEIQEGRSQDDLEATLRDAKRRLIVWGLGATWIFICIAAVVYYLTRKGVL